MHLTRMKLRLLFKNWRISCISILTHTQKVSKCRNKLLTSIHNCMQTDNHRRIQSQLHINNVLPSMQRIQPFVSYIQYAETHITKFVFKGYTKLLCELAYNGVSEKVHSTIIVSIARKCFKTNIPLKKQENIYSHDKNKQINQKINISEMKISLKKITERTADPSSCCANSRKGDRAL